MLTATTEQRALSAFALNCTLKASPAPSSTDRMLDLVEKDLVGHGASFERRRLADLDVRPGVTSDEDDGDQWPAVRTMVANAVHLAGLLRADGYPAGGA